MYIYFDKFIHIYLSQNELIQCRYLF